MTEAPELYRKHRPRKLSEIIGQDEAVRQLTAMIAEDKVPHAVLFTGSPGCGKTTLAHILRRKLGVKDSDRSDWQEINWALVDSPLDASREFQGRVSLLPLSGRARVWVMEEVQALSRAPFAQQSLLRVLEEPPAHAYFFLCTTEPAKLAKAVRSRCAEIQVRPLSRKDAGELVTRVCAAEGKAAPSDEVVDAIHEAAEGAPRKILVLLGQLIDLEGGDAQLDAVRRQDGRTEAANLFRVLMDSRGDWDDARQVLKGLTEDAETTRRVVLACCKAAMLGDHPLRALRALEVFGCFRDSFVETGDAGLAAAALEFFQKISR